MIGNILAKIFAGSAVGYITNYLAIQMLFREYLKIDYKPLKIKFGLGGVIVKERRAFEQRISVLVESDVIHHKAIDQELRKAPFEDALQHLIADLFQNKLPRVLEADFPIANIPEIESSFQTTKGALLSHISEISPDIWQKLIHNPQLPELLSEAQIAHISQRAYEILLDFVQNDLDSSTILEQFLHELQDQKLSDFLDTDTLSVIENNLIHLFDDLHNDLKYNYAPSIETIIEKSFRNLHVADLLHQLSQQAANKKLSEIFSEENAQSLPEGILENIRKLFESSVSEDIIRTLLKFVLNVLEEEDSTVFELLSDDLKSNFEGFLENKLPDILGTFIPWVQDQKWKLEELIQNSFQDNTSSFGRLIVSIFLGNIGQFVGIEEKLIDLIEKQDIKDLSHQASDYLQTYLRKNTIGDMIRRFSKDQVLNTLTPLLLKNIRDALPHIHVGNLQNIFEKPLKTWFSEERIEKGLRGLVETAIEENILEKLIYKETFTNLVQDKLKEQVHKLTQTPLKTWLESEKIPNYAQSVKQALLDYLQENPQEVIQAFETQLHNQMDTLIEQALKASEAFDLSQELSNGLDTVLNHQYNSIKGQALPYYFQELGKINKLDQQLSQAIRKYLLENLPQLMKGQIEELVRENLAKQPNSKLRDMVKKAMGDELRPLSYFGGALGTVTGALLLGLPTFNSVGATIASSGLAYGITGWGTNWLAIRMLFKPYHARKIPGTKIRVPFTPGVVAKHKDRFAKSMGRFIGDRLLNQDNLQENFSKNQIKLEQSFKNLLSQNDYAFIDQLIIANQKSLSQNLAQGIYDYGYQQRETLITRLSNRVAQEKNWKLNQWNTQKLEEKLIAYLSSPKFSDLIKGGLQGELARIQEKDLKLTEILPKRILKGLFKSIENLLSRELIAINHRLKNEDILDLINFDPVEKKIASLLEKNVEEILDKDQEDRLKNQIFQFLLTKLQSPDIKNQIFKFIDEKLKDEFAPGKKIQDFFGGKLIELLEKNLNRILEQIINMGTDWLKKNREKIAERVYQEAYDSSSLAWTYKSSIKGTTYDLIDKGIPNFFNREFESLQRIIHQQVLELGNSPFNTTNFIVLDNNSLKNRVSQILENQKLLRKTEQLTHLLLEERIFKIPLNELIKDSPHQLVLHLKTVLDPEIQFIKDHLSRHIEDPDALKEIQEPLANLLKNFAKRSVLSQKIGLFLKNLEAHHWQKMSEQSVDFVFNSSAFQTALKTELPKAFAKIKTYAIGEIIDPKVLQADLSRILTEALENEANKEFIQELLEELIGKSLHSINSSLHDETKDFLIELAAQAIFGALEENILPLINSMNFKEIVVREIEQMHPQQLETLFYGFAQRYFKYLIGYGFAFGVLFGLAIDLGLLGLLEIF